MDINKTLTIAGSDPSGGAGIQADIKTMSALGCYASSVITAVVDENTLAVNGIMEVPPDMVKGQIRSVMEDINPDAIKIGMTYSAETAEAIADSLKVYNKHIVLDPVMIATTGDALSTAELTSAIKFVLAPVSSLITPNIPEAEKLLGSTVTTSELQQATQDLSLSLGISVLLKGGHSEGDILTDYFYDYTNGDTFSFGFPRINTRNTHGTGCTLSSAITSYLAKGFTMHNAIANAEQYLHNAINAGKNTTIGHGHGPISHFWNLW